MKKSGIYIAYGGFLKVGRLKIGQTSEMSKMPSRYKTYYGPDVKLCAYYIENPHEYEKILIEKIKANHVSGEIYEMKCSDCKKICEEVTHIKGKNIN